MSLLTIEACTCGTCMIVLAFLIRNTLLDDKPKSPVKHTVKRSVNSFTLETAVKPVV